jgi:uncharacterized membrane protein (DUF106 family)
MITSYVAKVADLIFTPLLGLHPLFSMLFLSLIFSFILLVYQRKVFSKKEVRELKARMDEIKERIMRIQGKSREELNRLANEMIKMNAKLLKENLKVLLLSLILGMFFLSWVSFHYSGYYVKLPFPFLNKLSLIYFYAILCVVIGIIFGKFLEVK